MQRVIFQAKGISPVKRDLDDGDPKFCVATAAYRAQGELL
jgi:hypothetical protein